MRATDSVWLSIIAALVVLIVGISCTAGGVPAVDVGAGPQEDDPNATVASPVVTPLSQEFHEAEALDALETQIVAVYQAVSPSVVNITSVNYLANRFMRAVPQEGTGSGFVYDGEGHIVTNYHVIENAEQLLVTLASGQEYEVDVVGTDPATDLAVLRIADTGVTLPDPIALTDSDQLQIGQFVLAIGNPFGLERTLTTGVVSALGRVIKGSEGHFIGEAIQTDAAINPGNSGGPLLDLSGRVIGVTSQIISASGTSSGVGFAVSSNIVRAVVPELISIGYYPHPWLGVETLDLTPAIAGLFREAGMIVPVDAGVLVTAVVDDGPADEAGVRGSTDIVRIGRYQIPVGGDVIIGVDGEPVGDMQLLTIYLDAQTTVGDTVELTIVRQGETQVVPVTLGERPQTQD